MRARIITIISALMLTVGLQAQTAEFETATEAVKNIKIGAPFTLGLDGGWINWEWEGIGGPECMKMLRKAGFNANRMNTHWADHVDSEGKVDEVWMKRVRESVDYVIDQGMYCVINVADSPTLFLADEENYQQNKAMFEYLWRQIAEEFKDYDHHRPNAL